MVLCYIVFSYSDCVADIPGLEPQGPRHQHYAQDSKARSIGHHVACQKPERLFAASRDTAMTRQLLKEARVKVAVVRGM